MSDATPTTAPTPEQIANAVRNDHDAFFTLGRGGKARQFPIRDLGYDDYLSFIRLIKPVIESAMGAIELKPNELGEVTMSLGEGNFDVGALLDMADDELPRLALICCRQSDASMTVQQVKELGRRPMDLIEIVLKQAKHNQLVEEFASFFPRIVASLSDLAPSSMTEAIRSSLSTP